MGCMRHLCASRGRGRGRRTMSSPYLLLLSGLAFLRASAVAWGAMVEAWVQTVPTGG